MFSIEKIVVIFFGRRRDVKVLRLNLITILLLFINITASSHEIKTLNKKIIKSQVTDTAPKFVNIEKVNPIKITTVDSSKVQAPNTIETKTPITVSTELVQSLTKTKLQKLDTPIKFHIIKNGKVIEKATADINNIQVPKDQKVVVPYKQEISPVDEKTIIKLKSISSVKFAKTDLRVVPELHLESKDAGSKEIAYQLYFFPYQSFQYDNSLKKFYAKMGFFFLRSDSSGTQFNEIDPVNIIIVSKDVPVIKPRPLQIAHLNFPTSDIDLVGEHLSDSVEINVITTSKPEGYKTYLKVSPALEISTESKLVEGFGIGNKPIIVRFTGSNSSDSIKINLSAGKGVVTPNPVYVSYNSPATVYLHSKGMGKDIISAMSSNNQSNELAVTYVFPWLFLLMALMGGLIGGLAKYYLNSETKTFSMRPIIGGILIGFMGAVAYYVLGINLLGFGLSAVQNEFAVLGLSALCAYFGISKKADPVV